MPQGGLMHQFPMNAQGPHLAAQQQPGIPGLRPANFLQVPIIRFAMPFSSLRAMTTTMHSQEAVFVYVATSGILHISSFYGILVH